MMTKEECVDGELPDEARAFYEKHKGGSGCVVLAMAVNDQTGATDWDVFSEIGKAHDWIRTLGDGFDATVFPFVVDLPEYGVLEPS